MAGLSAGRGAASLVSAAWLVVVARHLSLTEFGDVVLLLALGAIFIAISDRGLQLVLAEHVAATQTIHDRILRAVLVRRMLVGAGCAVLAGGLYLVAAHDRSIEIPALFSVSILSTTVYSSVFTAYRALGYVAADAANEVVSRIGVFAFGTLWLANGGGIRAVVATYAVADLVSALAVYVVVRRRVASYAEPGVAPDLSWRATAPLAMAMVTTVVYYRVDTYLVGLIRGSAPAGLYGASYRVLEGALIPATVLASIAIAHAARPGVERSAAARRLSVIAVLATLPFVVAGAATARPLMRLAFGATFGRAGPIAVVLLVSALPGAVVAVLAPLAGITNRRRFAVASGGVLLLNVALNLVAISFWGPQGAAWVNVASQVLLALLFAQVVFRAGVTSRL